MDPEYRTALPAHQDRSKRTLEGILAADEALVGERHFEDVSMAEIAERSGVAVGTLYKRLPNKRAILACLLERQAQRSGERIDAFLRAQDGGDLPARTRALVGFFVEAYRDHRGVLRTLTGLYYGPRGADADVDASRDQYTEQTERLVEYLAAAVPGRRAQERARFAVMSLAAVCLNRIVLAGATGLRMEVSDRGLARELVVMLEGYLADDLE